MPTGEVLRRGRKWGDRSVARALRARLSGPWTHGLPGAGQGGASEQGATGSTPRAPFFSARFVAGSVLLVLAAVLWRATRSYATGVFDSYPLYYGAKAWLHGGNAYHLDPVVPLSHHGYQLFEVGNIYPLPAVLVMLPFSYLPPQVAGMAMVGLFTAGLLLALRLHRWPVWLLLYLPVAEALRIEQYTIVILILQIVALWALRERRLWLLACCCALILTKPNQGFFFVLAMLLLARHWRHLLVASAALWGGVFLLDPNWVLEWVPRLVHHREMLQQPFYWPLGLFAIPLLLMRDVVGASFVLQYVMLPFSGVYPAGPLPLTNLDDRRAIWLAPVSYGYMILGVLLGTFWATALTLVLPMVALSALRWWERRAGAPPAEDGRHLKPARPDVAGRAAPLAAVAEAASPRGSGG